MFLRAGVLNHIQLNIQVLHLRWTPSFISVMALYGTPQDCTLSLHIANSRKQGPVVRSLVSANRWLRGIKTYRFPWYLTLVSANHALSNPGQKTGFLTGFLTAYQNSEYSSMNYGKATQLSTFQEGSLPGSASKSPTHHHHGDASEKELTMLWQETLSAIKFGRSLISWLMSLAIQSM